MDAEDTFNQAAIDLIEGMSDMVDYVADVKQFATIAQLKLVLEEASNLMHSAVSFFNKYKRQGSFGEYFSNVVPRFTQQCIQGGFSSLFRRVPRKSSKDCRQISLDLRTSLIVESQFKLWSLQTNLIHDLRGMKDTLRNSKDSLRTLASSLEQ